MVRTDEDAEGHQVGHAGLGDYRDHPLRGGRLRVGGGGLCTWPPDDLGDAGSNCDLLVTGAVGRSDAFVSAVKCGK